ncbi:MAG TPA: DUF4260 family protein [Gaiellaceae bacterium]|nr:DUF4260 family protein [Gaiellaceae bacterium]
MTDRLPRILLHGEGVAVAVAAVTLYFHEGYEWWLLLLLALAPDLAMLGYAAGSRAGATAYDLVHTYVGPLLLGAAGVIWSSDTALALALIWLTHIGVDRAVGYGLKYPSGFKETHLQRV